MQMGKRLCPVRIEELVSLKATFVAKTFTLT
jgi:hypothetical protein